MREGARVERSADRREVQTSSGMEGGASQDALGRGHDPELEAALKASLQDVCDRLHRD